MERLKWKPWKPDYEEENKMPERFTRVMQKEAPPQPEEQPTKEPEVIEPESEPETETETPPPEPPEAEIAQGSPAQQQMRRGPQPLPNVAKQQMPETIQIPMAQFIQMQQQIQHATQLKPIPEEATTLKLTDKCATISRGGHELQALVIHQTQQTPNGFVEILQTLVLCKHCGASLAQIRGSLGL
jgi:hypothetical protein